MATKRKTASSAAPATAPAATAAAAAAPVFEAPVESWADTILRTNFASVEQDSIVLLKAASTLLESDVPEKVTVALDQNLKLWIAIKTVLLNDDCPVEPEVKANLRNLAQYVVSTTMLATQGAIETRKLVSLARLNMNIAEGLLSGQRNRMIQERAYQIWQEEGCPEGREQEHWLRAEAEISGLFKV
ncbi:DUF2934 domain-containing protein (plasmid) [Azospirillum oryzae]|uniref:DUF2934 domain-containing protein n=1 Tax=Azospirillum oryzae TaxID=286727 RepID=A0A6N1AP99_9PROT|nr:DUF2934 domain-containing protein [Azospirillum oryzae]KAA0585023.1 DUF2934 domain-containing protein [Azospirillum oryzae]QKS53390.1 DUF2934 domain-containing protein [Azospirillum oryzae]GLR80735.1 hypothetical protein GCM10007856_34150 [Azospirillum oryzae]